MSYDFENTTGGKLLAQLRRDIMEVIEVPNSMLPEEYHNNRDGVRTLAELDAMSTPREDVLSEHQIEKAEKAKRVEKYRQQWEENETIEYDVDEYKLHRYELAFVKGALEAGWIDEEDIRKDIRVPNKKDPYVNQGNRPSRSMVYGTNRGIRGRSGKRHVT